MQIKLQIFIQILLHMVLATAGLCSQELLDKERDTKLKQTVNALAQADTETLRTILSSEHQTMSGEEAASIIKEVRRSWGDLTKLKEVDESKQEKPIGKGDMYPLVHWGTLPTHHGRWMLFRSDERNDCYLKIGLLFGNGSADSGQLLVTEIPIPHELAPNKPDEGDGK